MRGSCVPSQGQASGAGGRLRRHADNGQGEPGEQGTAGWNSSWNTAPLALMRAEGVLPALQHAAHPQPNLRELDGFSNVSKSHTFAWLKSFCCRVGGQEELHVSAN